MATCEYEQLRKKNLEDNRRILAELGLSNPFQLLPKVIKKGVKRPAGDENYEPKKKRAKVVPAPVDLDSTGSIRGTRRLSARLRGQDPGTECIEEDDKVEEEHEKNRVKYVMPDRPNWYGEVPGVAVGTIWMMRMDCCHDGIHRPPVAGIHGGPDGAYSLALSGGYEDDIDLGDCFTYTGEGGRDLRGTRTNPKNLRTAPQSKDQELTRGNLALSRSVETGSPVRVIRGYKLRSPFAPDEGYRYDGLYTVEKFWFTKGLSGFGVYKFALRRCAGQAPPPWELENDPASPSKSSDSGFSDAAKSETCESGAASPADEKNSNIDAETVKCDTSSTTAGSSGKDESEDTNADGNVKRADGVRDEGENINDDGNTHVECDEANVRGEDENTISDRNKCEKNTDDEDDSINTDRDENKDGDTKTDVSGDNDGEDGKKHAVEDIE